MRTSIVVSPSLFALLLLAASGIATAVSTTVASSVRASAPVCEVPEPAAAAPAAPPTVDPLDPVLRAAVEAELRLGEQETLDRTDVARTAALYRFYVDEQARRQASGSLEWARSRAASYEQLRADMDEMVALEQQARALEQQARTEP